MCGPSRLAGLLCNEGCTEIDAVRCGLVCGPSRLAGLLCDEGSTEIDDSISSQGRQGVIDSSAPLPPIKPATLTYQARYINPHE